MQISAFFEWQLKLIAGKFVLNAGRPFDIILSINWQKSITLTVTKSLLGRNNTEYALRVECGKRENRSGYYLRAVVVVSERLRRFGNVINRHPTPGSVTTESSCLNRGWNPWNKWGIKSQPMFMLLFERKMFKEIVEGDRDEDEDVESEAKLIWYCKGWSEGKRSCRPILESARQHETPEQIEHLDTGIGPFHLISLQYLILLIMQDRRMGERIPTEKDRDSHPADPIIRRKRQANFEGVERCLAIPKPLLVPPITVHYLLSQYFSDA